MHKQPLGIEAGVYYNMPSEIYHADPALSSSGLKSLLENPREYWDNSPLNPDREPMDTVTLKNSRAFHTMLLEPEKFNSEFTIKPNCKTSGVKGMVGAGDYQDMLNAARAVKASPLSGLCTGGKPEVSIFWRDAETQIMCRVRFDYLRPNIGFDYKTTTNVYSKEKLGYAVADYGYDISAAMYMDGLKSTNLYNPETHLGFVLLFQTKKRPYTPRALRIEERIMQAGYNEFRRGLWIYKENIEKYGTSPWSSGFDRVEDLALEDMPFKYKQ